MLRLPQTELIAIMKTEAKLTHIEIMPMDLDHPTPVQRGWLAARDYGSREFAELYENFRESQRQRDCGRERERALKKALTSVSVIAMDVRRGHAAALEACIEIQEVANAALAASQPEVLSERSDTEPGEPEGHERVWTGPGVLEQSGSTTIGPEVQPAHGPGEPSEQDLMLDLLEERHNSPDWDEDVSRRVEALLHRHGRLAGESNG